MSAPAAKPRVHFALRHLYPQVEKILRADADAWAAAEGGLNFSPSSVEHLALELLPQLRAAEMAWGPADQLEFDVITPSLLAAAIKSDSLGLPFDVNSQLTRFGLRPAS